MSYKIHTDDGNDVSRLFREYDNVGADSSLWLRVIRQLLNDGKPPGKPVIVAFNTPNQGNLPFGAFMLTKNDRLIFWPVLPRNAEMVCYNKQIQLPDHVTLELSNGKTHITAYDSKSKAIHNRRAWRLDYSQDESLILWFILSLHYNVLVDQEHAVQRKVPTPSTDKERREEEFINLSKKLRLQPIRMPAMNTETHCVCCAVYLVMGELVDTSLDAHVFNGAYLQSVIEGCPLDEIPPVIASKISLGDREVVIAVFCPQGVPNSSVAIGFPQKK